MICNMFQTISLATDDCRPGKEGYAWFVEQINNVVNKESSYGKKQ